LKKVDASFSQRFLLVLPALSQRSTTEELPYTAALGKQEALPRVTSAGLHPRAAHLPTPGNTPKRARRPAWFLFTSQACVFSCPLPHPSTEILKQLPGDS